MVDRPLTLAAPVDRIVRRHAEETYPHECCGALVGRDGVVSAVVALPNTTEEGPRRRFLVRPADYQLAERRAVALGGDLLGFYHSHPDHPARPSQFDFDHAWPTFAYVIVAVSGDQGLPRHSAGLSRHSAGLSRHSAGGATAEGATAEGATAEGATAGDMTVWYLTDDRSGFDEGCLHHGENSHPDPAQAVHG